MLNSKLENHKESSTPPTAMGVLLSPRLPEGGMGASLTAIVHGSPQIAQLNAYGAMANSGGSLQGQTAAQGGLPSNLQSGIEGLSGIAMNDVRVHYNSSKPAQLQAHAYAQGTDIHLAAGQERHLAHEAWHVVQQKQGRVKPTLQLKGIAINDDSALEREADVMAARALGGSMLSLSGLAKSEDKMPLQRMAIAQLAKKKHVKDDAEETESKNKSKDKEKKAKDKPKAKPSPATTADAVTTTATPKKPLDAKESSGWNANNWDAKTMIEAAEAILKIQPPVKNAHKLKTRLGILYPPKQVSAPEDPNAPKVPSPPKDPNVFDPLRVSKEPTALQMLREILNGMAENGVKCPLDASTMQSQTDTDEIEADIAAQVLPALKAIEVDLTKKYALSPASAPISKGGSAVDRIKTRIKGDKDYIQKFLDSLHVDAKDHDVVDDADEAEDSKVDVTAKPANPFLKLAKAKPIFYGTADGQRIHVLAARYLRGLTGNKKPKADALTAEVTKELKSGEKESWPEVSNFWLAGSQTTHVGLVGERSDGVEQRKKLGDYDPEVFFQTELEILAELIDLRTGDPSQAQAMREQFIAFFHEEQISLRKDWFRETDRSGHLHKPGHDAASVSQDKQSLLFEDLICRRMCKWMLHVAHSWGQPVIYALDEIDLSAVAGAKTLEITDTVSNTGKKKLKVPVCTSELREIFRAQDKFDKDDPTQGGNVHFYEALMPVAAPWGPGRPANELRLWAEYALHLTLKLIQKYPGDGLTLTQAKTMVEIFHVAQHAQAIHAQEAGKAAKAQEAASQAQGVQGIAAAQVAKAAAAAESAAEVIEAGRWCDIITLYRKLKPSELRGQGGRAVKKGARDVSTKRKEAAGAQAKSGILLLEAFHVAESLQACILSLNVSTGAEVKTPAPPSTSRTASLSATSTGTTSVPKAPKVPAVIEPIFKGTVSNAQKTGIENLGQTCYLASGLNMLAFSYASLFEDEKEIIQQPAMVQSLRHAVGAILAKIRNNEPVSKPEIRSILDRIAALNPEPPARGMPSQAKPNPTPLDEKEKVKAEAAAKLKAVAEHNDATIAEAAQVVISVSAQKPADLPVDATPAKNLPAPKTKPLPTDTAPVAVNLPAQKPTPPSTTETVKPKTTPADSTEDAKQLQIVKARSRQLATQQQDASEIIFGTLFSILNLDTAGFDFSVKSTFTPEDPAFRRRFEEAKGISAPPMVQNQFRIELPIADADGFEALIDRYKNPRSLVEGRNYTMGTVTETTPSRETNVFLPSMKGAPPVVTVILKRFEFGMNPRKIGKRVTMPDTFVFTNHLYTLASVVFHHGSLGLGHYTMSHRTQNGWMHHNDAMVGKHESFEDDKSLGYMYVYHKGAQAGDDAKDLPKI